MEKGTDFVIVRGNDARFLVNFSVDEKPMQLEGVVIRCSVKDYTGGQKLFDAIVSVVDESEGLIEVLFPRWETEKLMPSQIIHFDFQLTFPDGTVQNFPIPPLKAIVVEPVTD